MKSLFKKEILNQLLVWLLICMFYELSFLFYNFYIFILLFLFNFIYFRFQTNPQHELFVNLFLQILSSHLPSSPLFPPSALHIKEILSQFKLSIGYSSSSSNFSSLHSSHRIHIPERHEYVLEFLDLPTKEQMTTSCCTYF